LTPRDPAIEDRGVVLTLAEVLRQSPTDFDFFTFAAAASLSCRVCLFFDTATVIGASMTPTTFRLGVLDRDC
jgi:hypothetical protein